MTSAFICSDEDRRVDTGRMLVEGCVLVSPVGRKGSSAACLKVSVSKVEEFGEESESESCTHSFHFLH